MSSEQLAKAARLYDEKRYEDALAQYALLAEQGDEFAARWAGWMIHRGCCARNDPQEAIRYYELAAASGSYVAWFDLGSMYAQLGEDQKAVEWYEKSATEGYLPALYRLGRCYQFGRGISLNEEKAAAYFEEAESQGHIFAKSWQMRRQLARDYGQMLGWVFYKLWCFKQAKLIAKIVMAEDGI
ncbi:MAG: sel1 repeat family protein [Nitrospira sp.]|nr:sel1 repeat family protein [Nitrospira sp.]